ncbi:Hypothetical protein NTJ_06591 [Nesidiocoris tenuis]|uniref:Uncharacterized protein n=1 Tax=Nesidiocoris tenuis TaxID=355587 RepID=A0ABN7ASB6_9HEMI|nr:Hypothetical protein NTJ_06591 [Nesidiocoris tenuis]
MLFRHLGLPIAEETAKDSLAIRVGIYTICLGMALRLGRFDYIEPVQPFSSYSFPMQLRFYNLRRAIWPAVLERGSGLLRKGRPGPHSSSMKSKISTLRSSIQVCQTLFFIFLHVPYCLHNKPVSRVCRVSTRVRPPTSYRSHNYSFETIHGIYT